MTTDSAHAFAGGRGGRAIFVTGWAQPESSLAALRAALGFAVTSRILVPADLSGGDGAEVGGERLSPYAAAVVREAALADEPAMVVGWSMGALIALEAAARLPPCVAALVLLAPTARFCAAAGYRCGCREALLDRMIARLRSDPEETLREFHRNAASPVRLDASQLQQAVNASLALSPEELAAGLAYLRETDLRGQAGAVKIPSLLVHGSEDRIVPCGASEVLARLLPAATRRVIGGAGHDLPRFDLDSLRTLVFEFGRGLA
jgi:pimeloyl-[acyl-carrier protein] methyl ester esterase